MAQKSSGGFGFLRSTHIGAPSAWVFLVRLHACRAGLRFPRRHPYKLVHGGTLCELSEKGRTVRSVAAPNCGNQGTSVLGVLQSIDRCGTLIPTCTLTPPLAHPLPRGEGRGEGQVLTATV